MIAGLRRRIGQLEERIGGSPATLHFADGSTRVLHGDVRRYFGLLADGIDGDRAELADAIRNAISVDEPDHIVELLQAILQGPNESTEEPL